MIEVREERPAERRFVATMKGDYDIHWEMNEPELRELVEKGAKALGIPEPTIFDYVNYGIAKEQLAYADQEVARLRAWLKRLKHPPGYLHGSASGLTCSGCMAAMALAGEEAPGA